MHLTYLYLLLIRIPISDVSLLGTDALKEKFPSFGFVCLWFVVSFCVLFVWVFFTEISNPVCSVQYSSLFSLYFKPLVSCPQ